MAKRPIFVPGSSPRALWSEVEVEFRFYNGFSHSQKSKSIRSLHESAAEMGYERILEVSTKSSDEIGWALSAFNLSVPFKRGRRIPLECAFQGSKVFEGGVQFDVLYELDPIRAKKDPRLKDSGDLIGFCWQGQWWENRPRTAFYDWLYLQAIREEELGSSLLEFDAFSDIEFNPRRSVNCQARSCSIFVALSRLGLLDEALSSKERFVETVYPPELYQPALFGST